MALFAAAKAHGLGFGEGVPSHVYERRRSPAPASGSPAFAPAEAGETPDLLVPSCDILQVWLDVRAHPSRGREPADLIRRKVIEPFLLANAERLTISPTSSNW